MEKSTIGSHSAVDINTVNYFFYLLSSCCCLCQQTLQAFGGGISAKGDLRTVLKTLQNCSLTPGLYIMLPAGQGINSLALALRLLEAL